MVKNRILTSTRREIKSSFPRFLSLLLMSFLGTFVFSGLKATPSDMNNTLSLYLNEHNTYDIKLVSSIGFNGDEVNLIKEIDEVKDVEISNYNDYSLHLNDNNDYVIELISIPSNINNIDTNYDLSNLKNDEILIEESFLSKTNYKIGDTISINDSSLLVNNLKIAGTCVSPLFFNNVSIQSNRGKTNIGSGTINFYGYINLSSFNLSYYKNIYITLKDSYKYITNSDKYNELVDKVINKIKNKETDILKLKNNTLYDKYESLKEIETFISYKNEVEQTKKQVISSLKTYGFNTIEDFLYAYNNSLIDESLKEIATNAYKIIIEIETYETKYKEIEDNLIKEGIKIEELSIYLEELETLINESSLYIYSRIDDTTYKSYIDDSNSISNLSLIFPLVFYIVAILVSLISMSRMVDDERTNIGTLKSLGFSTFHILIKYIYFAFFATFIGSILGVALGIYIIPTMINSIYKILFDLPYFKLSINYLDSLIGIIIALVCIVGTTIISALRVLKENSASLLRPKAPKKGKKVFLENFKWLWKKISFSKKVTIRNISRYKKRVIVTIVGIAGCTALMLTGWGIRDSITDIPAKQYNYVTTYDASIYFNNASISKVDELLKDKEEIKEYSYLELISGSYENYDITINVMDSNNDNFQHYYDIKTNEELTLKDNEIFISDKFASLNKINVGDILTFNDNNSSIYSLKVGAIIKNYIYHYVYLTRNTYENITNKEFKVTNSYISLNELNKENEEKLKIDLLKNEEIINVMYVDELIDSVNDMLTSLNKVVIILIVLAGFLAFVVLYNLSAINIHERKREIATLKVLGFRSKEVDHYITSENIILTIIGIILGLIFGYFLANIVVSTVEIEYVRFIHKIKYLSYIYSALFSLAFTLIINLLAHFTLKRIDMIESLKSVE